MQERAFLPHPGLGGGRGSTVELFCGIKYYCPGGNQEICVLPKNAIKHSIRINPNQPGPLKPKSNAVNMRPLLLLPTCYSV